MCMDAPVGIPPPLRSGSPTVCGRRRSQQGLGQQQGRAGSRRRIAAGVRRVCRRSGRLGPSPLPLPTYLPCQSLQIKCSTYTFSCMLQHCQRHCKTIPKDTKAAFIDFPTGTKACCIKVPLINVPTGTKVHNIKVTLIDVPMENKEISPISRQASRLAVSRWRSLTFQRIPRLVTSR